MSFNDEISDGLDEIASEANVELEYWRAAANEWMPLCGYIEQTTQDEISPNASTLQTATRSVCVRNWQEQLVLFGEPFLPDEGDRIRQGNLLMQVMPMAISSSFGGSSNVETHGFLDPDQKTMRINTKVLEGMVP